jgi:hypothetical protein
MKQIALHSPGPWTVYTTESQYPETQLLDANGNAFQGNASYYPYCSSNRHDWFLQAASPEMLELLIKIAGTHQLSDELQEKAYVVISKALGDDLD